MELRFRARCDWSAVFRRNCASALLSSFPGIYLSFLSYLSGIYASRGNFYVEHGRSSRSSRNSLALVRNPDICMIVTDIHGIFQTSACIRTMGNAEQSNVGCLVLDLTGAKVIISGLDAYLPKKQPKHVHNPKM